MNYGWRNLICFFFITPHLKNKLFHTQVSIYEKINTICENLAFRVTLGYEISEDSREGQLNGIASCTAFK